MNHHKVIASVLTLGWLQYGLAQSTLRGLAADRGKYVGSAANSATFWKKPTDPVNYRELMAREFNMIVAENEMKPAGLQPQRNQFSWAKADEMIAFARANGMRVRGHTMVWHESVPNWIKNPATPWTRETLLAVMKTHIDSVATHFKGKVDEYDVVNEAVDNGGAGGNQFRTLPWTEKGGSIWGNIIGPDYIDSAFVWTRRIDPKVKLYYNDYGLESFGGKAQKVLQMVKDFKRKGVPIDGVGLQGHLNFDYSAASAATLGRYADSLIKQGVEVALTELDLGIPSGSITPADFVTQAKAYGYITEQVMKRPQFKSLVLWGFTDKYTWLISHANKEQPLLFDAQMNKKPSYDSVFAVIQRHPKIPTGISERSPSLSGRSGGFLTAVNATAVFVEAPAYPATVEVYALDGVLQSAAVVHGPTRLTLPPSSKGIRMVRIR